MQFQFYLRNTGFGVENNDDNNGCKYHLVNKSAFRNNGYWP